MALIDVKLYYKQLEEQYLNMVTMMNEVDKEYKSGSISQEQFDFLVNQVQKVKENYERISYILFLFNIPKSQKNRKKFKNISTSLSKTYTKSHLDEKSLINENSYVLKEIEKTLSEVK